MIHLSLTPEAPVPRPRKNLIRRDLRSTQTPHQQRPGSHGRHQRRMDHRAHRHLASVTSSLPASPPATSPSKPQRSASPSAAITPAEVEVIIVATVTPDMMFPATACLVQDKLGASHAWGFDLSAACSGFPYAPAGRAPSSSSPASKRRSSSSVRTSCPASSITPTAPPVSSSETVREPSYWSRVRPASDGRPAEGRPGGTTTMRSTAPEP